MDLKNLTINDTYVDRLVEADEITEDDIILFTEDVYSSNYFSATIIGKRHILARVTKLHYGDKYLSFSMDVIECIGDNNEEILNKKQIRRREKTIFGKYKVYRRLWNNEFNRYCILDVQEKYKIYTA